MMIFTLDLIYSHRARLGGSKVYFCHSLIKFFSFLMSVSMAFRSIFKCSVEKPVATSVSKWLDFCKSWGQAFFSVDCPKLPLNFKNDFSLKILFYHVLSFFLSDSYKARFFMEKQGLQSLKYLSWIFLSFVKTKYKIYIFD